MANGMFELLPELFTDPRKAQREADVAAGERGAQAFSGFGAGLAQTAARALPGQTRAAQRSIGGMFGLDTRTDTEKMQEKLQGINMTSSSGLREAAGLYAAAGDRAKALQLTLMADQRAVAETEEARQRARQEAADVREQESFDLNKQLSLSREERDAAGFALDQRLALSAEERANLQAQYAADAAERDAAREQRAIKAEERAVKLFDMQVADNTMTQEERRLRIEELKRNAERLPEMDAAIAEYFGEIDQDIVPLVASGAITPAQALSYVSSQTSTAQPSKQMIDTATEAIKQLEPRVESDLFGTSEEQEIAGLALARWMATHPEASMQEGLTAIEDVILGLSGEASAEGRSIGSRLAQGAPVTVRNQ